MNRTEYELEKSEKTETFLRQVNEVNKNTEVPYLFEDDILAMAKEYVKDMDKIQMEFIKSNYDN